MNVLVTDANYTHTLGIVRSLGRKGFRVSVLSESPSSLAARSRYCHGTEIVPCDGADAFLDATLRVIRKGQYDLLIPVGFAKTLLLAQHRSELTPFIKLEVADAEKIELAANKARIAELAGQIGLRTPKTLVPATPEDVRSKIVELEFPVVVKARRESPGKTTGYARTPEELLAAFAPFCGRSSHEELPIVQEFIPGFGCGFFACYQDGICKRIFMHRRIREVPPSGGRSSCAESFYSDKLRDNGTRILGRLGWHGVAMAEFRYDERDGEFKLLEINPKFWGSLDIAIASGADFPYYICQIAQGQRLDYSEDYERNLRYHWPLSADCQHAWLRPSSLGAIFVDLLNPKVRSNIWVRDLRPNVEEALSSFRSLRQTVKKG